MFTGYTEQTNLTRLRQSNSQKLLRGYRKAMYHDREGGYNLCERFL